MRPATSRPTVLGTCTPERSAIVPAPVYGPSIRRSWIVTPSAEPRRSNVRSRAASGLTVVLALPAPRIVRFALSITAPGEYVPAARSIVSPAVA